MIKGLKPNPQQGAGREASVDLSTVRVIIRCGVKGQGRQRARGRQPTPAQARSKAARQGPQSGPLSHCGQRQHFWTTFPLKETDFISIYCFLREDSSGCCLTIPAKKPMLWASLPPCPITAVSPWRASRKPKCGGIVVGNRRWRCA